MKNKFIALCTILICILFSVGCSNDEATDVSDFIEEVEDETQDHKPIENINKQEGDADVDLTILSSTMVFGEVFNIVISPEEYLGKTIKIRGEYYSYYDNETDNNHFFVVIADAAACCQQGLEFVLNEDYRYPEDYPEDGAEIEFTGVFDEYEEAGHTYYYLIVDEIAIL